MSFDLGDFNFDSDKPLDASSDIAVESIKPNPYQPRKSFDDAKLQELADSIADIGLLQPVVVVKSDDGYTLISGERRLRAHLIAGLDRIKAVVMDTDDIGMRKLALAENVDREDLTPIEIAQSVLELWKQGGFKSKGALAEFLKKSESWVSKRLAIFNLPDDIVADAIKKAESANIEALYDLCRVTDDDVKRALYESEATREEIREAIKSQKPEKPSLKRFEFRDGDDLEDIAKAIKECGSCTIVVQEIVEVKEQNGGTEEE